MDFFFPLYPIPPNFSIWAHMCLLGITMNNLEEGIGKGTEYIMEIKPLKKYLKHSLKTIIICFSVVWKITMFIIIFQFKSSIYILTRYDVSH